MTAQSITEARREPRLLWLLRIAVALWVCVPTGYALMMATFAMEKWHPGAGRTPVFMSTAELAVRLYLALGVAIGFVTIGALGVMMHLMSRQNLVQKLLAMWAPLVASVAVPVVYVFLATEDPYDGTGSPLAILLGMITLSVVSGVFFTLPALRMAMAIENR